MSSQLVSFSRVYNYERAFYKGFFVQLDASAIYEQYHCSSRSMCELTNAFSNRASICVREHNGARLASATVNL